MKRAFAMLFIYLFAFQGKTDCLTAPDVIFWQQLSYNHTGNSVWRIGNKKAYTTDNNYNDMAINLRHACALVEDELDLAFSVYGLTYFPWHTTGPFETDRHRWRVLIDQLSLAWNANDRLRLEGGKLSPEQGAFFLKSPANLLPTSYAGFKPTRLYDTAIRPAYEEAFWGARVSAATVDYALSLTAAAKFARIDKRYETTGSWSPAQRSNARERYVLSWADYRLANHTPSLQLRAGDSPAIAFADAVSITPQLMINAELAIHRQQQWRHFAPALAERVRHYDFVSALYEEEDKSGVEFAVGGQYTTDRLNMAGFEYYYQSEGYSQTAWRKQKDFINYLHRQNNAGALGRAYDAYQYLMAAEISNTRNQGMLLKKHYIHGYANIITKESASLQPWLIVNMQDGSAMLGIHFQTPLTRINEQLEAWIGAWSSQGNKQSEFALFGDALGMYLGFKFFL